MADVARCEYLFMENPPFTSGGGAHPERCSATMTMVKTTCLRFR